MKRLLVLTVAWFATLPAGASDLKFVTADIYLESSVPVAAWQFELSDRAGDMQVVGVENGSLGAFPRAPYYDREAVAAGRADRIVVADYSLEPTTLLPSGRFRVATLHLALPAEAAPDFQLRLITATTHEGRPTDAAIDLDVRTGSEPRGSGQ